MPGRVLLTGGSGFLGRWLAQALRRRDYEVLTPCRPAFDLLDRSSVERAIAQSRPDIVVHAAADYGGLGMCLAFPADIFYRNALMSLNMLDAAARGGVRRFLAVGASCAYPASADGDMKEDNLWFGPLHPSVAAYGLTKRLQEIGLRAYSGQLGMKGQFPLLATLYGEHDVFGEHRAHVAAALIKKFATAVDRGEREVVCWGSGRPVREFLYVGDAAEGIARLLDTGYSEPLNIGTGIGTTIKDLALLIAKHTRFTGNIVWDTSKPDGAMHKVLEVSRMKKLLNWEPPTGLEEGLAKTIRWYLVHKEAADCRL